MNKLMSSLLLVSVFLGCASMQRINYAPSIPPSSCNVKVYSSLAAAEKEGEIEELCIISGTSSGSFSHTVATAIKKHKNKACECGADNVYIQAQDAVTLGTASVTLIGFRFISRGKNKKILSDKELFDLAKQCQEKGGVWVNDRCQLPLD